jgi:uncharacterized protein YjbI with pentapeptide repeats
MRLLHRRDSEPRRFRTALGVNIALLLTVAVLATAVIGVLLWLALGRPSLQAGPWTTSDSFDFAKVVLAIVGGIGAVVALVIAYRKQHLGEAAEFREDAKLFAERFTKAADQLGSDKAPVRLAGMYALEDLAQGSPDQRQTIVNVLCAYLRMPYLPPAADDVAPEENERREQERQVRLTAQRIIAAHLRPGKNPKKPVTTFWANIDLDLTGAILVDLDLSECHTHFAQFMEAQFSGNARFERARFGGDAVSDGARFDEARFMGAASFSQARFDGQVTFNGTWFGGEAAFPFTRFLDVAGFHGVRFDGWASFERVQFSHHAIFREAHFNGPASFDEARFEELAEFSWTQFCDDALFNETQFRILPSFTEARVRLDVPADVSRIWPASWSVTDTSSANEERPPDTEGQWGILAKTTSDGTPEPMA